MSSLACSHGWGGNWKATSDAKDAFERRDRKTGELVWTGSRVDLIFGSHS